MPTVLRIGRHRFFFFSNEGSEPVHVHIESAGKVAKFWIRPVVLAFSSDYSSRELRQLRELVMLNEKFLLEQWNEFFSRT